MSYRWRVAQRSPKFLAFEFPLVTSKNRRRLRTLAEQVRQDNGGFATE